MKSEFTTSVGDALEVGVRAQVSARHHVHEGMVGKIIKIGPDGMLDMVSNSDTRFWAAPEDVMVVQPS